MLLGRESEGVHVDELVGHVLDVVERRLHETVVERVEVHDTLVVVEGEGSGLEEIASAGAVLAAILETSEIEEVDRSTGLGLVVSARAPPDGADHVIEVEINGGDARVGDGVGDTVLALLNEEEVRHGSEAETSSVIEVDVLTE